MSIAARSAFISCGRALRWCGEQRSEHGLLFLWLVMSLPAFGQTYTGSLVGVVTDPGAAVVPGVKVTLVDVDRGYTFPTTSDETGRYALRNLRPGVYRLTAEIAGFKTYVRDRITLELNQNATLDVTLELGALTETVSVAAETPLISTEEASTGQVVNQTFVNNLPLVGRAVFNLATLAPGVTEAADGLSGGTVATGNNFISNGTRNSQSDVTIDGITATTPNQNTGVIQVTFTPTPDAVQEFKVMQNSYDASIGFGNATVVNAITKSGTNEFHGNAYEYHRNSALNANSFFANRQGQKKLPMKQNMYGGTLGGPIIKNKTFFFTDYEGLKARSFWENTFHVPDRQMRAGDFGIVCTQIGGTFDAGGRCSNPEGQLWDPYTGVYDAARGGAVRSGWIPFNDYRKYASPGSPKLVGTGLNLTPGAPGNLMDPVVLKMMSYLPDPNIKYANGQPSPGYNRFANFYTSGINPTNNYQWEVKIDHRFGANDSFTARHSYFHNGAYQYQVWKGPLENVSSGPQNNSNRHISLNYNHIFGPRTLLTVTGGVVRRVRAGDSILAWYPDFDPVKDLGLPADFNKNGLRFAPRISVGGAYKKAHDNSDLGPRDWTYQHINFDTYQLITAMSHTTGRHELKFGAEQRVWREFNFDPGPAGGAFSFTKYVTSQYPNSGGGDEWASALTGVMGGGSYPTTVRLAPQSINLAGFLQDNWRVTDRLTLNLGLRYELPLPETERFNHLDYLDPDAPFPLQVPGLPALKGGLRFCDNKTRSPWDVDSNNWAPRFGFAYKLGRDRVVRGGYGIFYSTPKSDAGGITGNGVASYYWSTQWLSTYQGDGATPNTRLSNAFWPTGIEDPPGPKYGLMTRVGKGLSDPIRKNVIPYVQTWSFGIQQQLPGSILVDASYVGTKGTHLYFAGSENLDFFGPWIEKASREELNRLSSYVPNPFYGYITDPTASLAYPTVQASQLLKQHPQFTGFSSVGNPVGSSIYHSFQLRVEKRLSKGLQFLVTYTDSKSIDDSSAVSGNTVYLGGATSLQNPNNRRLERSLSMYDIAQVLQFSYVYQLPFGRGMRWGSGVHPILNAVLGGWQTNGIWRFDTGMPIRLALQGGRSLPTYGAQRPNLLAPLRKNEGPNWINQYFANPQDAVKPPEFAIGNAPRCLNLRAPGTNQASLSLFKSFSLSALREGARVEVRAESFNALNHPIFRTPAATVNTPTFGQITQTRNGPREVQMALKIYF